MNLVGQNTKDKKMKTWQQKVKGYALALAANFIALFLMVIDPANLDDLILTLIMLLISSLTMGFILNQSSDKGMNRIWFLD